MKERILAVLCIGCIALGWYVMSVASHVLVFAHGVFSMAFGALILCLHRMDRQ